MIAVAGPPLLDADAVRQLQRLSVVHLGAVVSGLVGQRAGPSGARGLEFADYRPYRPGDDLRRIDWNIYARLGEAYVKTAPSEAHVEMALLLDASASMDEGEPTRFRYAQQLAALLGTVALLRSDAVAVHALSDGTSWSGGTLTAPQDVLPLVGELAAVPRGRRTDLAAAVAAFRDRRPDVPPDVAVLLSDAQVSSGDLAAALAELSRSARTTALVHLVDPGELAPGFRGATELRDRETGERLIVDVTASVRDAYAQRMSARAEELEALAARHGVTYLRAVTTTPPLDLLFAAARRAQLVSF